MKSLLFASIVTVSSFASAFPSTLNCETNIPDDSYVSVVVTEQSIEISMHETFYNPILRSQASEEEESILSFENVPVVATSEGDEYKTTSNIVLTYSKKNNTLSMTMANATDDLGVGSGGFFLNCK